MTSHSTVCLNGDRAQFSACDWLWRGEQCSRRGRRKCLHMWVWGGCRTWPGDSIDVLCARVLMWTEAGWEKEMFLYRYPSLSAHHLAASWPWHHGGLGQKTGEAIGSLCSNGACLRPVAATSVNKPLVSGLITCIDVWAESTVQYVLILFIYFTVLVYFIGTELID